MARSRAMIPLVFRMELCPTGLECEFEADAPVVLCCERRGTSVSTSPTEQEDDSQRIHFEESLVFNLLIFRADDFDGSDLVQISPATRGIPLPGFESVMTRIAIRQGTSDGEVCDVAAVDLANYIVGSHGVVEDKIEMQLGSFLSFQVLTTMRKGSFRELLSQNRERDVNVTLANLSESALKSSSVSDARVVLSIKDNASLESLPLSESESSPAQEANTDDFQSEIETPIAKNCTREKFRDISSASTALSSSSDDGNEDAGEVPSEEESEKDDDREHNRIILNDHPFTSLAREREFGEVYICVCDERWEESPIISNVMSPLPISIWSVQGPEEIDPDEEDDMDDLGDGLMAPKRNIAKLQAAAAGSSREAGPPALPGMMSPLQKTIIRPSRARRAITIALAKPLDLSRCTVLRAIQANDQNPSTIPEPVLSDCDEDDTSSESDEEDDSSSESMSTTFRCRISSLESNDDSNEDRESTCIASCDNQSSAASSASPDRENEETGDGLGNSHSSRGPLSPETAGSSTIRNPSDRGVVNEEKVNNKSIENRRAPIEDSMQYDSQGHEKLCEDTKDVEGHGRQRKYEESEYLRRIAELEAESVDLRHILKKSRNLLLELRNERDNLLGVLNAKNDEECVASEACSDSERERIRETEEEIARGGESILTLRNELELCRQEKFVVETELEKLKAEMVRESSLRLENERLLTVILSLKQELDREPGVPEVIEELKNTKNELAAERARSESLEAELAKLSTPKASKSRKGGFFGKSSSSSSKSKKKKGDVSADSPKSIMDNT